MSLERDASGLQAVSFQFHEAHKHNLERAVTYRGHEISIVVTLPRGPGYRTFQASYDICVIGAANPWHSSGKVPGYVSIDDAGDAAVRGARSTTHDQRSHAIYPLTETGRRVTAEAGRSRSKDCAAP